MIKQLISQINKMRMRPRKIIAKRCSKELKPDSTIHLGIGVPEGIAMITLEEGISNRLTMTVEAGAIGKIPTGGTHLGFFANVEHLIGQINLFDYYDGGGLDTTFLGLIQADQYRNINVSKFNGRMMECALLSIFLETQKMSFSAILSQQEKAISGLKMES